MCSSSGMSRLRLRDGRASKSRLRGQFDKAFIPLKCTRFARRVQAVRDKQWFFRRFARREVGAVTLENSAPPISRLIEDNAEHYKRLALPVSGLSLASASRSAASLATRSDLKRAVFSPMGGWTDRKTAGASVDPSAAARSDDRQCSSLAASLRVHRAEVCPNGCMTVLTVWAPICLPMS